MKPREHQTTISPQSAPFANFQTIAFRALAFYHECRNLYRSLFSEFNRRKSLPVCFWKAGRWLPLDSMSWQRRDSPSCDCFDHLRNSHLQQNLRCGLRSIRSSPPAFDLDGWKIRGRNSAFVFASLVNSPSSFQKSARHEFGFTTRQPGNRNSPGRRTDSNHIRRLT